MCAGEFVTTWQHIPPSEWFDGFMVMMRRRRRRRRATCLSRRKSLHPEAALEGAGSLWRGEQESASPRKHRILISDQLLVTFHLIRQDFATHKYPLNAKTRTKSFQNTTHGWNYATATYLQKLPACFSSRFLIPFLCLSIKTSTQLHLPTSSYNRLVLHFPLLEAKGETTVYERIWVIRLL